MSTNPDREFIEAINRGVGLRDEFIFYMDFDDYKSFPDPFPRNAFTVKEVQESIFRYPNPEKPLELFRWDIHGRLLTPAQESIPKVAIVMIHGGAANEYEFLLGDLSLSLGRSPRIKNSTIACPFTRSACAWRQSSS